VAKTSQDLARGAYISRHDAATQGFPLMWDRRAILQAGAAVALAAVDLTALAAALVDHLWWVLAAGILCLAYEGLYIRRLPFWREARQVVKAVTLAFVFVLAAISLGKRSGEFSRTVLVLSYLLWLFLLPAGRLAAKRLLSRLGLWV